ncbi:hypothetical protein SAMN05660964_03783 [Thiothrix caldifontis]|uniref:Adenylate kinase n=1 Tax=Thiothrix caldifontis TaxID=525918 RepID=A0A1H4GWP1_9GAMM|nr:AAA family ATPase [Thiothrix caldifontis]SEB14069.1 hypothetical protein SAMN05660964_03783 [Thiothrix caldifontis]
MKHISIYGVSGVGKTTVIEKYKSKFDGVLIGSESKGINEFFGGNFNDFLALNEEDRQNVREKALSTYFSKLSTTDGVLIIDAHYSFWVDGALKRVIPPISEKFYTHFIYINPGIKEILRRQKIKWGKCKFSEEQVNKWIEYETNGLEKLCHMKRRAFYQLTTIDLDETISELNKIVTN